jgi:hypothetical protein
MLVNVRGKQGWQGLLFGERVEDRLYHVLRVGRPEEDTYSYAASGGMKDRLYRYNCGTDRSSSKVKQLHASLTPEQRKELRTSFKNNGYDINYIPC